MIRIHHVLYALALLASYASLYSLGGIYAGCALLAVWAYVFYSSYRPRALFNLFVVGMIVWAIVALLSPVVTGEYPSTRSAHCRNNLKMIAIALYNYHDVYGAFPPAYVADENGKPMHSWRVLLLPYIDQEPLYKKYNFDEPWDSSQNAALLNEMPDLYACPSIDNPGMTNYVAIVGPGTAWPGETSTKISDFKDGGHVTLMVIESHAAKIPWTAPRDLSPEEAAASLASADFETEGHRGSDFFHEYFFGKSVLFMDGSVKFAPFGMNQSLARELFTLDDGKPKAPVDLRGAGSIPQSQIKWGRVIQVAIFVILTILPLPWVWWNPTGASGKSSEPPDSEATA